MYFFEWDEEKNETNKERHGVSFESAKDVFYDKKRIIIEDVKHSENEQRFFCFGLVKNPLTKSKGVLTVRFTLRADVIRIIGAGFWRKGKAFYEKENKK